MGRRYEVWRCEFEKLVRLQHKWCELELLEEDAHEVRGVGALNGGGSAAYFAHVGVGGIRR